MSGFHRSSSRERPARPTLSLILNPSNSTLRSPIHSGGGGFTGTVNGLTGHIDTIKNGHKFGGSEIRKFIDGDLETSGFGIPILDKVVVGFEDGVAVGFLRGEVGATIGGLEVIEGGTVLYFRDTVGCYYEG